MTDSYTTSISLYLIIARKHWKVLLKAFVIGLLAGLFIAFSIPKEYESVMLTAAESTAIPDGDDFEGLSFADRWEGSPRYDALRPSLYPDIFSSYSFLVSLFDLPVQTIDCPPDSTFTLYEYLDRHQRRPWWVCLTAVAGKFASWVTSPFRGEERNYSEDIFGKASSGKEPVILALSAKDTGMAAAIRGRIKIEPDEKTRTVTISCRMQDPLVAATVLDSLGRRIQAYITEYRTRKERAELATAQTLQRQAREKYYQAQESQAAFEDRNRNLATRNAQKELVKLRILTAQAYQEYTRTTLQVHAAETQVIRVRPVFAVIQPATTPVRPASPSKMKYMVVFGLLGIAVGYARIWWKQKCRR